MMLISVVVLKFKSNIKINRYGDVIILKTMKTWKCQHLSNRIKYIVEIWYVEVIHNADFDYYTEIGNN